jgi:hypothetical protein
MTVFGKVQGGAKWGMKELPFSLHFLLLLHDIRVGMPSNRESWVQV